MVDTFRGVQLDNGRIVTSQVAGTRATGPVSQTTYLSPPPPGITALEYHFGLALKYMHKGFGFSLYGSLILSFHQSVTVCFAKTLVL